MCFIPYTFAYIIFVSIICLSIKLLKAKIMPHEIKTVCDMVFVYIITKKIKIWTIYNKPKQALRLQKKNLILKKGINDRLLHFKATISHRFCFSIHYTFVKLLFLFACCLETSTLNCAYY